jgi:GT2 family glycosyltransferase
MALRFESMTAALSVVIVAYENNDELIQCVDSVFDDDTSAEVVVVVNCDTTGATSKLVGRPGVVLLKPGRNLGFAAGCNLGAVHAKGDVLLFLNPDTTVLPGALHALASAARRPGVALAMPRLRLRSEPNLLNSGGGAVHLCGLGWATGFRQPAAALTLEREVAAASGAAMAVRRETFVALGGFLDELFLYHEDAELSWRAHLQGLHVLLVPDADVLHAYQFSRHPAKYELLERNRLIFILTLYSGRLLAVLAPVLIAYEVAIVVVAARQGWLNGKLRGWQWCWNHREWLRRRRRDITAQRSVTDRQLSWLLTPVFDPGQVVLPPGTRLLNACFSVYWSLAQRLL